MGVELAQLFVIKLFNLNIETLQELDKVNSYDFDIFNLRKGTDGNELATLVPFLLAKHGLVRTNDVDFNRLLCFVRHLAAGYKSITYHNQTHAADVCQTFNYFVTEGGMKDRLKLDCLEEMSCIISAALHDFQPPGVNNVFLVNMND